MVQNLLDVFFLNSAEQEKTEPADRDTSGNDVGSTSRWDSEGFGVVSCRNCCSLCRLIFLSLPLSTASAGCSRVGTLRAKELVSMKTWWLAACGLLAIGSKTVVDGMIVMNPCCYGVEHVLAAFGPQNFSGAEGAGGVLKFAREVLLCDDDGDDKELVGNIALVPRGRCRFVEKVLLAQKKGARGVVVYNGEVLEFGEGWVKMAADPELGDLVQIPSVFVSFPSFSFLDDLMEYGPVSVFINGTEEYDKDDFGASPLFLKSIVFMLQLLLVVWSMVAVFYLITWLKLRLAQRKRMEIVRKLPTRKYKVSRESPSNSVHSDECAGGEVELAVADRKNGRHRVPMDEAEIEMQVLPSTESDSFEAEDAHPLAHQSSSEVTRSSAGRTSAGVTDYYDCESCVICISNFEDGESITVLPCGHGYHKECIEPWLISKSALCPICKQSILPSGDSRSLDEIAAADRNGRGSDNDVIQSRSLVVLVGGVVAIAVGTSLLYILKLYD